MSIPETIPWEDLRLFLAVVEHKSFNKAAAALRIGQPTVSRRIAVLEETLGHALFQRSIGGVVLTTAGERLVLPAQRMAEWAGEALRQAQGSERAPEGVVRIAAPPGIAFGFLSPFAVRLKKRLPRIHLELRAAVEYLDLSRGDADLAIRSRAPQQGDLVSLASRSTRAAVFAAKSYAKRLKKGYGFADVDWICWAPPYDQVAPNPQLRAMIPGFQPVFASDDFLVQWSAAQSGIGAMILGDDAFPFGLNQTLVRLDLDLGPTAVQTTHLVCAKSAVLVPRIKAVADALLEEIARL